MNAKILDMTRHEGLTCAKIADVPFCHLRVKMSNGVRKIRIRLECGAAPAAPFLRGMSLMDFLPFLVIPALFILFAGFRIAQQFQRGVVLRFGKFVATRGPGLFWIVPLIDSVTNVDLRVVTSAVSGQEAISRDNVPIRIDAVIWRRIVVAERSVFEVRNVEDAVTQVAITTLRDIIGRHTLDEILKEQTSISEAMQTAIDTVTEPWGVKVERVE